MNHQFIISVIVLLTFVASIAVKSITLRKRGVRALVFGETDKSDFFLIALITAVVYAAVAPSAGLPVPDFLGNSFWSSAVPGWFGLALCFLALIILIPTLVSFGDSFRVGIDEKTPSGLVTGGMFRFSRNPVYLCFLLVLTGLFLIHHNVIITITVGVFSFFINRQVLREEKFLEAHYGEEYIAYKKKVRRYL